MADIEQIRVDGADYNLKDATAKSMIKSRVTVSSSSWSASPNASGYYTNSLTLSTALDTTYAPNVYLAGSADSTFPTDAQTSAFNLLDRAELTASTTLVLYAKAKPSSTFYVFVEGRNA